MAVETLFRSQDFPPAEVFGQWCEVVNRVLMPCRVATQRPEAFCGELKLLNLGSVQITSLRDAPLTVIRDWVHVRRADPGAYCLSFTLRGTMLIECRREQSAAAPGGWMLFDTWHPGSITKLDVPTGTRWDYGARQRAATRSDADLPAHVMLHVPRDCLPLPHDVVEPVLGRSLPPTGGAGTLLARLLTDALARGDEFSADEAVHVGRAAADLAAALLARVCGAEEAPGPESRTRALVSRITAFIECNLANPSLSPAAVASAHHISVRYLQQLLQGTGASPSALIRRQRLERCRADLEATHTHERPVHEIGARWGLSDATQFSRAFRAMYGMPPGQYRAAHRQQSIPRQP
jgi:AraC-like DNA-binding protein